MDTKHEAKTQKKYSNGCNNLDAFQNSMPKLIKELYTYIIGVVQPINLRFNKYMLNV